MFSLPNVVKLQQAATRGLPKIIFQLKPLAAFIFALAANSCQYVEAASNETNSNATPTEKEVDKTAAFDLGVLQRNGLDPKVANYFRDAPRFSAGTQRVLVYVNGTRQGTVDANFNTEGRLCFTKSLLEKVSLKIPDDKYLITAEKQANTTKNDKPVEDCYDYINAYPQTEVELRPGRDEVALVVTADTISPAKEDLGSFQDGGVAGLLNYDIIGQNNLSSNGTSRYYSANTELGLNAGDWLVRSRQVTTIQDGIRNFQSLYTYAQKTFVNAKSMLQAGQINILNSAFPGAAITGLQVTPDDSLQQVSSGGATIEGVAQSQARVEVRQAGALIYSTLVPAGPFRLPNVQLLNGNSNVDVRVIEANGEQRNFTVPAASLGQTSFTVPGFSFAVGKVRTFKAQNMESPIVATATNGWLLNPQNKFSAGLMASQNSYQAVAGTLDSALTPATSISLRTAIAKAGEEGVKGAQASVSVSTNLTESLNASLNMTRQTAGYRDLLDTTQDQTKNFISGSSRESHGLSLGWSNAILGGFSAGYSTSTSFNGVKSKYITGSWGKTYKYFTLSANIEKSVSKSKKTDMAQLNSYGDSDALYLTISVPLGNNRSARAYVNKHNDSTRFGTTYSDNSNEVAGYQLTAESNTLDKNKDLSGNLNLLPRYARLNLGYSQNGKDNTNYSGELTGGVAMHKDGITFSPYPLDDTFAIAEVSNMSGVKLSTPSGPVWTDHWGQAVVAQLPAYRQSDIEIATKSLPHNVDIQNGHKQLKAGRGSVNTIDFSVIKTRRVLLKARDTAGKFLAKGSMVVNEAGKFVTAVVDGGRIFLTNSQLGKSLTVSSEGQKSCTLEFNLPDQANLDVYFESADAVCNPT